VAVSPQNARVTQTLLTGPVSSAVRRFVNTPESWRAPLSGFALPGLSHKSFVIDR
jgi:hypothetical protein